MVGQEALEKSPASSENSINKFSLLKTIAKNVFAVAIVAGFYLGLETGYFSNDRTSRTEWNEMERLKASGKGSVVYDAVFDRDLFKERGNAQGYWDFYNEATSETASITDGALQVQYTSAWIGAQFRHSKFEPSRHYRVRLDAKVEEQAGAILMRNRQLDLMREEIPVTGNEFKEFVYYYTAPGGARDQVNLIFMPNERANVKGRMTIRRFRIELLGG